MGKATNAKTFVGDTHDMRGEIGQTPIPAQEQQGRSHPWQHLRSDPYEATEPSESLDKK